MVMPEHSESKRPWQGVLGTLFWLKALVAIGFAFAFCLSANLWLNVRTYPLSPLFGSLPQFGHPLDWLLLGALFVLLAFIGIRARPQNYIWTFLGILALLCLYDQTRWQPYIYQYVFLFATLALFSWRSDDAQGRQRTLNVARLIVASTYIYSGLQKMNAVFVQQVFPWLVQPIVHLFPSLANPLYLLGFVAPFIQVGFGAGLLTKRFRRAAIFLAVAMHVFILWMIGPWGLDWNSVVWPWTIAMACFDILLFGGGEDFSYRDILLPGESIFHGIVLALFGIMPLLSFFNLWDSDLSATLYSGNLTEGDIYLSDAGASALPAELRQYVAPAGANSNILSIKNWALADMNAIEYPETRVFKDIAKAVCSYLPDPTQMVLVVHEARLFRSDPQTVYHCSEL